MGDPPPSFSSSWNPVFLWIAATVLTKTDSSHQAGALVVMLKESDLLSHTVIGARPFGWFCQQMGEGGGVCDWAGLCSEGIGGGGSQPRERQVKGEVLSWKSRAWDRKGRGLPHGILGPGKAM